MNDNFKSIYKILKALEKAMDYPEFDISQIGPEKLGISQERWARYIEMLVDTGYIKGVRVYTNCTEVELLPELLSGSRSKDETTQKLCKDILGGVLL